MITSVPAQPLASSTGRGLQSAEQFSFTDTIKAAWDAGQRLRLPVIHDTFKTDSHAFDWGDLNVATYGGFRIVCDAKIKATDGSGIAPRISGDITNNITWTGYFLYGAILISPGTPVTDAWIHLVIECSNPTASGTRQVKFSCDYNVPATGSLTHYDAVGHYSGAEITSVGVQNYASLGNIFAAESRYSVERFL